MPEPPSSDPALSAEAVTPSTEWFWTELDLVQAKWNVLEHPFYARWAQGRLTAGDLADYAEEQDHLVSAVATLAYGAAAKAPDGILRDLLRDVAHDEDGRLPLWRRFVRAAGWDPLSSWHFGSEPADETVTCAHVWAGDPARTLALDVVTLCALQASLPAVASWELRGLRGCYGYADDAATAYFSDRAGDRRESDARIRSALAGLLAGEDCLRLLAHVESVHFSHWQMLDGLQKAALR
jgi:pyrroloquinoline quinone (PQQ) biosynthesis protein C